MSDLRVVLYNIRSLHNVGSIFRTADAVLVSKIYLCGITPKPQDMFGNYRKEFSKVALGAEKSVSWEYSRSISKVLNNLKKEKYKVIALEQFSKSIPYFKFRPKKNDKIALILGNEVKGVPVSILNNCSKVLEIPMIGSKESLNVSVAFGVVVFYLRYCEKHKF